MNLETLCIVSYKEYPSPSKRKSKPYNTCLKLPFLWFKWMFFIKVYILYCFPKTYSGLVKRSLSLVHASANPPEICKLLSNVLLTLSYMYSATKKKWWYWFIKWCGPLSLKEKKEKKRIVHKIPGRTANIELQMMIFEYQQTYFV